LISSSHRSFNSRAAATSRGSFFTAGLIPVLSDSAPSPYVASKM
jgi:hypothetical protein